MVSSFACGFDVTCVKQSETSIIECTCTNDDVMKSPTIFGISPALESAPTKGQRSKPLYIKHLAKNTPYQTLLMKTHLNCTGCIYVSPNKNNGILAIV